MFRSRRRFSDLSEQEILALAISSEEDDARIYRTYAERLRAEFPASAAVFDGMAAEEDEHRRRLIDLHKKRFGDVIPLIRREHVSGFYARRPVWLIENLGLERMRDEAEAMETRRRDGSIARPPRGRRMPTPASCWAIWRRRRRGMATRPTSWQSRIWTTKPATSEDRTAHRQFVLTWVQPGLAGLMDGSVSDAGADLRHRLRDAGHAYDLSGRAGGVGRRGHFDGLHRGGVGRRRAFGARLAGQARLCQRAS